MRLKSMFLYSKAMFIAVVLWAVMPFCAWATEFKTDGQQTLPEVTVGAFSVGAQSINIHVPSHSYVYATMTSTDENNVKKPQDKTVTIPCSRLETTGSSQTCQGRSYTVSGNRADGSGNYKVEFEKPLTERDRVVLKFADDGNFMYGSLVYAVEQKPQTKGDEQINSSQESTEEVTEQKVDNRTDDEAFALKMYMRSIEAERNKTWHERLKSQFEDHWYNFKDWWHHKS